MNEVRAPALYFTRIRHTRVAPVRHAFEYRGYSWYFDLDNPPAIARPLRPFASFRAADHLAPVPRRPAGAGTEPHDSAAETGPHDAGAEPGSEMRARVDDFLARNGIDCRGGRITALMNARSLGYVFDPLTVFWCHDAAGELRCVIAEVHNTYGERHPYLVHTDERGCATVGKEFYVSPFNAVEGCYTLRLPEPGRDLDLGITLLRDGEPPFAATMTGHRVPVTTRAVLRAQWRTPFAPWLIAARIRRHGIALWARGLPIVPRPRAESSRRTAQ
ncbi:DUF1365 domain-containing protein [Nocardia sp. NPDC057668]|uniref:DUF1365 domain-containing protein n=1 Tax=Nocardia sp. NPDC057668 TaxID=3346202 RepID=UPI00366B6127